MNLNNEETVAVVEGRAVITHKTCSIITMSAGTTPSMPTHDDMVRRALTAIGACALSDYGSISGTYTAEDGTKTCYMWADRYGYFLLLIFFSLSTVHCFRAGYANLVSSTGRC
jgi:hypothetical protein